MASKGSRPPLEKIVKEHTWVEDRGNAILKDPETHQIVETLLAKTLLTIMGQGDFVKTELDPESVARECCGCVSCEGYGNQDHPCGVRNRILDALRERDDRISYLRQMAEDAERFHREVEVESQREWMAEFDKLKARAEKAEAANAALKEMVGYLDERLAALDKGDTP